jgi:hypothetical protein
MSIYVPVGKNSFIYTDTTTNEIKAKINGSTTAQVVQSYSKSAVTQITSASTGVTLNAKSGIITTVALTTAAAAEDSFIVTNSSFTAGTGIPVVTISEYTGAGTPIVGVSKTGTGTFTISITNTHASAALDAAMKIGFVVL